MLVECVPPDQIFRHRKFRFCHGDQFKFPGDDVRLESLKKLGCIFAVYGLRPDLDGECGSQLRRGEAGNPNYVVRAICDLVNRWGAGFKMVELYKRARIEEISSSKISDPRARQ